MALNAPCVACLDVCPPPGPAVLRGVVVLWVVPAPSTAQTWQRTGLSAPQIQAPAPRSCRKTQTEPALTSVLPQLFWK